MSEEFFEIAFSGQVVEGADLATVRSQIGKIFKADEQRLAQLFSGRRVLIKRRADSPTMAKYRGAFERAGAVCEIRSLSDSNPAVSPASSPATSQHPVSNNNAAEAVPYQSRYPESDQVPQALLSDPLGIQGEQIAELHAEIAPIGSQMQHQIKEVPPANFDLHGLEIAPVGSMLSTGIEDTPPPPPDTSGLSLAD